MVSLCIRASSFDERTRGLLGRASLPREEGLLIETPGPIHTCGMKFSIDVLFLDRQMRVVGMKTNLKPWRFAWTPGARYVLELAAGRIAETDAQVGDRLGLDERNGDEG
ncbi:DUF192 domain-containing protein [candidate division WOR-3 bacterium]|nr:DUF192 domain-containing protein [candidate division WOR-3 bacterium]